ncbi:DinB family protein [Mucilaginibacter sp. HMF5004]|uniref:DinB family protein n=1 Tax=Mucilaginibacter rivuli TaxID=2857527 RepID=UPI001C5EF1A0|nr:DinB family protein [Mucilaginibacter rivuli]MBW4889805.1 DinB family protein [Mucilaginibacter rivuli]
MEKHIATELTNAGDNFLKALSLFTPEEFNKVPFKDSWTAGQIAEHIYKSIKGVPELLTAKGLPTQRDPEQNVAGIRQMFLDFSTKMKSPDFILPSNDTKDKADLMKKLDENFSSIIAAAKTQDHTLTIKDFEFPGSGPVTRIELLNFISVHTQRHTHQLQKVSEAMVK